MIKDIDRIIWPEVRRDASTWNQYLYLGFLKLGLNIKRTESPWDNFPDVRGILPFDIIWNSGRRQRIWYDFGDFSRHYYEKTTKGNDLYFKIQLHKKDQHYPRIYPIGQITCGLNFLQVLPEFRTLRKKQNFIYDVIGIFRASDHGIRTRAVEIVNSKKWKSLIGMAYFRNRLPIPEKIARKKFNYEHHLRLQCRSKICLDFPGVGGEWSWRFTEILGMGCFCLRTKPFHACPGEPQNCWGEINSDLSDLAEKIDYYLNNETEREQIAKNGLQYYEKYLSPEAQAKYILNILSENQAGMQKKSEAGGYEHA